MEKTAKRQCQNTAYIDFAR